MNAGSDPNIPSAPTTSPDPPDWKARYALGLPDGSVRALLALLIFSTLWGFLLLRPDLEVPEYLRDLLFIIMGHYFAVRARARREHPVGPPPLFLPRGTIRVVSLAGFLAVAYLLFHDAKLDELRHTPAAITLLLVGGFLLGVLARSLTAWLFFRRRHTPRWLEDTKALVALAAALVLALLVWNQLLPFLPIGQWLDHAHAGAFGPELVCSALVGFYFGTRS